MAEHRIYCVTHMVLALSEFGSRRYAVFEFRRDILRNAILDPSGVFLLFGSPCLDCFAINCSILPEMASAEELRALCDMLAHWLVNLLPCVIRFAFSSIYPAVAISRALCTHTYGFNGVY